MGTENPMTATEPSPAVRQKLAFYEAWERLVNKISPLVSRVINLEGFLQATVTELGRLMDVDRCNLMVYSHQGILKIDHEYLRTPDLPPSLGLELPVNRAFLLSSGFKYEPYSVSDIQTGETHPELRRLCAAFGTQSLLIVPVTLGDELLALIGLHHCRQAHEWSATERQFIQSLADQIAVAFQYARLYLEKEREVKLSQLLLKLIDALYRRQDMDQVLALLLDHVLDLLKADNAGFGHLDSPGHTVHFTIRRSRNPEEEDPSIPERLPFSPDSEIFTELSAGSHVLVAADSQQAHQGYRLRKTFDAATIVLAPLHIKNALFGVMVLLWREAGEKPKPDDLAILDSVLRQAGLYFERNQLVSEILHLKQRLQEAQTFSVTSGTESRYQETLRAALEAATSDLPVCLMGEPGSGRSFLAEFIHKNSRRDQTLFRKITCRDMTPDQFREKVLGRTFQDRSGKEFSVPGIFETARGGTLYFHEVDQLPAESQADLLELLELGYLFPEGSRRRIYLNHRLLFSVSADLPLRMDRGLFQADLWAAISRQQVAIPSLREHPEDIPQLAAYFLRNLTREDGTGPAGLSPEAEALLRRYSWPGNIRELRHVLEKAGRNAAGPLLTDADLAPYLPELPAATDDPDQIVISLGKPLADIERAVIRQTLEVCGHDKQKTARVLGISRKTLYRKIARFAESDASNEPNRP
jgi:DNA-binding NtrC family response regulator